MAATASTRSISSIRRVLPTATAIPRLARTIARPPAWVPKPSASLPTSPIIYNANNLQTLGVYPYNMCILKGFPTALKSKTSFPFGVWFANATTLYVADEGNGTNTYDPVSMTYKAAASQTTAGLQKWVFNGTTWSRYTS